MGEAIIETNLELTICKSNNDMDNEIDVGMSSALDIAIKDTDIRPTTDGSNNNTNNEVDAGALGTSDAAIKNTDIKPTANGANNNMEVEVDVDVFIGGAISKMDVELTMGRLYRVNTIVGKKVYEFNLFWLLLTSNKSLVPKIILSRPLLSGQHFILMNC